MAEPGDRPLPVGSRVVVRHLIEDGERATDTVGELLGATEDELLVGGRHGDVRIRRSDVVAAKPVPDRPWRVAAFLRRAGVAVLDLDGVLLHARVESLLGALATDGTPVVLLSDDTDRVAAELEEIGLARCIPMLLDTHDLGAAKPETEAYAAAHAEIERRLGRRVAPAEVAFTDDRADHVDAARAFGWRGQVFTLPR
ncbi:HAD family hydrolase [uncultured Serinicoccus sp.]|uniref:HAD family hydrolase n=1 Tax=uncultured Serinicoccus sp. TaxID=735514 RepID=UPI00262FF306|nr:HAD family hydrolase [uncultured Serinicoccus sp.]